MAVSNGQVANQTSFNNGLLGRNSDDNTTGKLDLLNADTPNITDIQSNINGNAFFLGRTVNTSHTQGPVWTSATVGVISDSVFARVDAITEEFNDLTPYVQDASNVQRGVVNTGVQSFAGVKTFEGDVNFDDAIIANNILRTLTAENAVNSGASAVLDLPQNVIVRYSNASLTGVDGINNPAFDQFFVLTNITGGAITIKNEELAAATDIVTGTGADVQLEDGASLNLYYDLQSAVWRVVGGTGVALAAVGSSPNANGATLTGSILNLEPADGSNPGVMTAIAQTLGGLKTFAAGIVAQVSALFEGTLSYDSEVDGASTGANVTLATPAKTIVRLTNASLTSVEGITAPATNQVVTIINDTGNPIDILNLTGTAANQIDTGSADDLELIDGAAATLIYDLTGATWRITGGAGGGGAGGGLPTRQTFNGTSFVATEDARQVWVYDGLSPATLTSIDNTNLLDQAEIELTGSSNGNSLLVEEDNSSGGIMLNGPDYELGLYSKLVLRWDATFDRFIEVTRNGR